MKVTYPDAALLFGHDRILCRTSSYTGAAGYAIDYPASHERNICFDIHNALYRKACPNTQHCCSYLSVATQLGIEVACELFHEQCFCCWLAELQQRAVIIGFALVASNIWVSIVLSLVSPWLQSGYGRGKTALQQPNCVDTCVFRCRLAIQYLLYDTMINWLFGWLIRTAWFAAEPQTETHYKMAKFS